ncbi:MAG TPA: hypothetical protein VMY59_09275 [Candidatus Thermoplasmatota archaeon]|nr:hypothetical protein [Candidatus Thermoplasmatota archaeon]
MPDEIKEPEEPKCYSLLEYLLFKIDRTLAISGTILIALTALWVNDISEAAKVIVSGIGAGLLVYIGGRGGNK